jgi:hypothetical protein
MHDENHSTDAREDNSRPRMRYGWVFCAFLAIALVFLALEHRAHLYGALPYLLLLACPLMHLFMHHGHGSHVGHGPTPDGKPPREK